MRSTLIRVAVGALLVGLGWAAGVAQTRAGDFELRIDAVAGRTEVQCVRGCGLIGARDIPNPGATEMRTYGFDCNSRNGRCQANVVGFITR